MRSESAKAGDRCLAYDGRGYSPAIVLRVNEDGTFNLQPGSTDAPAPFNLLGVSRAEVLFNDDAAWKALFPALSRDNSSFALEDFADLLRKLGKPVDLEKLGAFWNRRFQSTPDSAAAYKLILDLGYSAESIADRLTGVQKPAPLKLHKQYINYVRMGGRDPSEVRQRVGIDDVRVALGLGASADAEQVAAIDRRQSSRKVVLPADVRALLASPQLPTAIGRHCLGPSLVLPTSEIWDIRATHEHAGADGQYAVEIIQENQGICTWLAVFNQGDDDARVYVTDRTGYGEAEEASGDPLPPWHLVSPTLSFFLWDLMQTAYVWTMLNDADNAARLRRTDIGLAMTPNTN
jgi:hypothetical protein